SRRARPSHVWNGVDRRQRDHDARRHGADEAAARAHRLHLPVLQPAADADRGGEHHAAADDRGREDRPGLAGAADRERRPEGSGLSQAFRAVRWPAAAGRNRPRADLQADGRLCRRADRQPRLEDRRRDPRTAPAGRREHGPDDGDGHARPALGVDRRPHSLPRRRRHRQGTRPLRGTRRRPGDGGDQPHVRSIALRGLFGRKLRTVLTAFAIVLGIATISGTFVLTDSITHAFHAIFNNIYRDTDASITGRSAVSTSATQDLPPFDDSLLAKVRALPDVQAAIGGVGDIANLIGKNGKVISFGLAPHLGFSVDPAQPNFNSLTLREGSWPGADEVVIDRSTARKKHILVGDQIRVEAQGSAQPFTVSGLVTFGSSNLVTSATLAGFNLQTAQKLFHKESKLDQIRVKKKPGVGEQQLLNEIRQILPPQTQVRSGISQAETDASDTSSFTSFLQKFLLAFGFIALFVGAFVIANSLSITITQRTREFATLRTIGASRRQILRSVLLESFVIGALASVIGLLLGLALAKLLFWVFGAFGFTLPTTGLPFKTRTIVICLVAGIVVTMIASL